MLLPNPKYRRQCGAQMPMKGTAVCAHGASWWDSSVWHVACLPCSCSPCAYFGMLVFLASVGSLACLSQGFLGTLCRHCVGPSVLLRPTLCHSHHVESKVCQCWVAHGKLQDMSVLYFVVAIATATSTWHMLCQCESFDSTPREKGVCQLDLMFKLRVA